MRAIVTSSRAVMVGILEELGWSRWSFGWVEAVVGKWVGPRGWSDTAEIAGVANHAMQVGNPDRQGETRFLKEGFVMEERYTEALDGRLHHRLVWYPY
jgi:hypothetical protein